MTEFVVINGGVAEPQTDNVIIVDFDNLRDVMLADPETFAYIHNELIMYRGKRWADLLTKNVEEFWRARSDTYMCEHCSRWVVDEAGIIVDITGGDVCTENADGPHVIGD